MTAGIPARFVQLIHTSVDRNDGRGGGWQVMDVRGAPTGAERAELESRVPTQVSWPVPIPEFVDPREQAALPARLVYARTSAGGAAYWHSVPAGLDGTGRPGNVFTHVLLDRRPWEPRPLRPAELGAAGHWLRPFGAAQVRAVDLAAVPEPPWSSADPDVGWRDLLAAGADPVFAVVLDAVRGALRGGPRVVLAVSDDRVALRWIAAAGQLMSPGTARRFYWSTAERARGLRAGWERGLHLAAVPLVDLDAVGTGSDVVVVREGVPPRLGSLGADPHEGACTPPVPVSAWSVLAAVVLQQEEAAAHDVLVALDGAAETAGDDGLLDAAWPMALAVRRLAVPETDEADVVLREDSPAVLPPELRDVVEEPILREIGGPGTADAYAHALAVRDTPQADRVAAIYLRRAVADRAWLRTDGGAPFPPVCGSLVLAAGRDVLAGLTERAASGAPPWQATDGEPGADAADLLRLLVLLVGAGVLDRGVLDRGVLDRGVLDHAVLDQDGPGEDPSDERARQLVERLVLPELTDPTGARRLIAALGPLAAPAVPGYVRPVVSAWVAEATRRGGPADPVPGDLLAPSVLRWLYPDPPRQPYPTPDGEPDPLLVELAVQVTAVVDDPTGLRVLAASALAGRRGRTPLDDERLDRLVAGCGWSPAQLSQLLPHVGAARLAPALVQVLLCEPPGPALDALCEELDPQELDAAGAEQVARAVRLRVTLGTAWWLQGAEELFRTAASIVQDGAWLRGRFPELAPQLVVDIAAAAVVSAISRRHEVPMPHGLVELLQGAATHRQGQALVGLLDRIADEAGARRSTPVDRLLAVALVLSDPAAPWAPDLPPTEPTLQAVLDTWPGPVPLPEVVLRERARTGRLPGGIVDEVLTEVRSALWRLPAGSSRATDAAITEFLRHRCAAFARTGEEPAGLLHRLGLSSSAPPQQPPASPSRQEP